MASWLGSDAWGGLAPPEQVFLYDVMFADRTCIGLTPSRAGLRLRHLRKNQGRAPYTQIPGDFKADLQTPDEYLASYVISDAAQQLCPELIWQLRNSAEPYTPPRRNDGERVRIAKNARRTHGDNCQIFHAAQCVGSGGR